MTSRAEIARRLFDLQEGVCALCKRPLLAGASNGDIVTRDGLRKTSEDYADLSRLYLAHPVCRQAFQEGRNFQERMRDLERLPPNDFESRERHAMTEKNIQDRMAKTGMSRQDTIAAAMDALLLNDLFNKEA